MKSERLTHPVDTNRSRGSVEARSIRRLPDQFDGAMLINAKGLPWQYSMPGHLDEDDSIKETCSN